MRLNANRQKIETSFTRLRTAPNPRSITVGHIDDYKVNAIKWWEANWKDEASLFYFLFPLLIVCRIFCTQGQSLIDPFSINFVLAVAILDALFCATTIVLLHLFFFRWKEEFLFLFLLMSFPPTRFRLSIQSSRSAPSLHPKSEKHFFFFPPRRDDLNVSDTLFFYFFKSHLSFILSRNKIKT